MKKMGFLVLLLAMACALSMPAQADDSTFTLMVYLCGSDLETQGGQASLDILEILESGLALDDPVTVIVQTGGAETWQIDAIDPAMTERWILGDEEALCVESLDRQDMGDAATLSEFISFCASEFPADRYGLILWNHGSGSTGGVCFDELTGDYLTAEEINAALEDAQPVHLSFIGFDACLMATFEMANYVKDYADYMIASEELAPGLGFNYEALVGALCEDPGMDMEAFGRIVVDSFLETNLAYDPDDYMTLSVLDLSGMDALTAALETLGEGLCVALDGGELRTISRHRQNMRSFGDFHDAGSDMVDLLHFVEVFADVSGVETGAVRDALDDVVAYHQYTREHLDNICGMSILMPLSTRDSFDEYSRYYDPLSMYPRFSEFLAGYVGLMNGGNYAFASTTPQTTSGWMMLSSLGEDVTFSGASTPFISALQQIEEAGETDEDAFGEDGIFTYSLELTDEDTAYLAYVEGNLMIDISDEETEAYIDLGYLQNAVIDWDNNTVYSLFDGTWPILEGQVVHMIDQIITEKTRRSLIDVTVNDEQVYLLVVFDDARPDGEIIGYTEGYTDTGAPTRGYQKLRPGDVIVPQYYLYMYDEDGEEYIEAFEGDPIEYTGRALTFGYESLVGVEMDFAYAFCLNDIFGDYHFSDFIFFEL